MFIRNYLFILLLCFACAAAVAQEEDSVLDYTELQEPLIIDSASVYDEEENEGEVSDYVYYNDSIQGKGLDSAAWSALTKDLNYGDTLDTEQKPKEEKTRSSASPFNFSINSTLTKYILFGLVVVLLVFLLYKIIGSALSSRDVKITKASATFEILHDDEQMMQKDLNALLTEALQQADYKTAIRILFIQSLQDMQDRSLIQWKKEKTNRNYVQELTGKNLVVPFSAMVLLYEKAWYSLHPSSKEDLETFYTFKHQLSTLQPA